MGGDGERVVAKIGFSHLYRHVLIRLPDIEFNRQVSATNLRPVGNMTHKNIFELCPGQVGNINFRMDKSYGACPPELNRRDSYGLLLVGQRTGQSSQV